MPELWSKYQNYGRHTRNMAAFSQFFLPLPIVLSHSFPEMYGVHLVESPNDFLTSMLGVMIMLCCPPDGRPSTHQGGMAVAAAWVPVCAEDLTWRQLPLLFWTNIRISTAIAANINHLHRKYKRIWTIWVFIFTGKFSRDCRSKGWYSLSSWIHLQIWILNKDGHSWPIMMWIIRSMTTLFSIIPINFSFKMLLNFSLIEPCITNWAIEVAVHLPRWQPPNFCLQTHQPTINNQPTNQPTINNQPANNKQPTTNNQPTNNKESTNKKHSANLRSPIEWQKLLCTTTNALEHNSHAMSILPCKNLMSGESC